MLKVGQAKSKAFEQSDFTIHALYKSTGDPMSKEINNFLFLTVNADISLFGLTTCASYFPISQTYQRLASGRH